MEENEKMIEDNSYGCWDNDDWYAPPPVGIWLDNGLVNDFMREWRLRKQQLKNGEISEDEYFEWKINCSAVNGDVDEEGRDNIVLGKRIKRIRTFRGLTQRELGLKLGYEERNADIRIAQYESGYRFPKNKTLKKMAKILNVNYIHFTNTTSCCVEDIMLTLLWLDEDDRSAIRFFHLVRN